MILRPPRSTLFPTRRSSDLGNTIMIMTGAKPEGHITHSITHPTAVNLEQTDEGADAALAIKSNDGTATLMRFRAAVLPEIVEDRKSTRLNSSHPSISYAVFC